MSNQNTIQYRQVGDYLIPNLNLPLEEASVRLGKWGMLYKDYLFNHKKVLFTTLLDHKLLQCGQMYLDVLSMAVKMYQNLPKALLITKYNI